MLYPLSIVSILLLALIHLTHGTKHTHTHPSTSSRQLEEDTIPFSTRAHWMRTALSALYSIPIGSPCQFAPFASVIVNHSDTSLSPHGKMICMSVNQNAQKGNPTLHGEIATIENCTHVLTDPEGEFRLKVEEMAEAWRGLSIYTNGEPCPMCASAIRWSGFKECIYGTSIETVVEKGWGQISISSEEVFEESSKLPGVTRLLGDVLANETDPYFSWQFDTTYPCPPGCGRTGDGKSCVEVKGKTRDEL